MIVDDLYDVIEGLIKYPFSQICVHSIALDILSVLERNGEVVDGDLIRAIVQASAGDELALEILKNRKMGA